jgi:hypothetical protein
MQVVTPASMQPFSVLEQCRCSAIGFSSVTQSLETIRVVAVDGVKDAREGVNGEINVSRPISDIAEEVG